ncbi:DNA cytosine methyltransferase [Ornithinimicrobium sp. CNJ-824]|uniref:DNA cytosine methyltransferase n=1 Tax=Ornithinimicrobium sp. CNJ-824 TaxID=1904966 RepID=UPI00096A5F28
MDHCLIQFRPSGIRLKKPTYTPALVAMAQTPLYGPEWRWLTPREAARLQGFPEFFNVDLHDATVAFRQLGNAIHVGSAYHVLREHVKRNAQDVALAGGDDLIQAVNLSMPSPDLAWGSNTPSQLSA